MTAVEFLVQKLKSQGLLIGEPDNLIAVREAKEMEKQQIIDAVDISNNKWRSKQAELILDGKQYYNKTF